MKKALCILLSFTLSVALTACGAGSAAPVPENGSGAAGASTDEAVTASAPAKAETEDIETQVLVEDTELGIKITANSLKKEDGGNMALKLQCENNSDLEYLFYNTTLYVNGCAMSNSANSLDVPAGKKAILNVRIEVRDLAEYGITTIGTLAPCILVRDTATDKDVMEPTLYTINTTAADGLDFTYTPAGKTLYDENGLLVTVEDVVLDQDNDYNTLPLTVVNNSEETIYVSCTDVSVNDYEVHGYIYDLDSHNGGLQPGKCNRTSLSFFLDDLDESVLSDTNKLEFRLKIYATSYDNMIGEIEKVSVEF